MRLALLPLLFLTACAAGSPPIAKTAPGFCGILPAEECVTLLDQQKMTGRQRAEALIAAGTSRLESDEPELSIPFFDAVIQQDRSDATGHQLRAKALAALAEKFGRRYNAIDSIMGEGYYALAATEYTEAIALAPEREANYLAAVAAFTKSNADGCAVSKSLRAAHEKRFGQTADQAQMIAIIKKKCGVL